MRCDVIRKRNVIGDGADVPMIFKNITKFITLRLYKYLLVHMEHGRAQLIVTQTFYCIHPCSVPVPGSIYGSRTYIYRDGCTIPIPVPVQILYL